METSTLTTPIAPSDEAATATAPSAAPDAAPTVAGAPELPTTFIRPASGWQLVNVRELWQYRELLFFLTWRDEKRRFKTVLDLCMSNPRRVRHCRPLAALP